MSKLDIFEVLRFLDEGNLRVYDALSEDVELLKELHKNISWLIPQWMTAAHHEKTHRELIASFEEHCNPGWGVFYKHPELQTKLLANLGRGRSIRHMFVRPNRGGKSKSPELDALIRDEFPDIKDYEIPIWCNTHDEDDLEFIMDGIPIPKEHRGDIRKQYKMRRSQA